MSEKRLPSVGSTATARRPRAVLVGGAGCRVADQLRGLEWEVCALPFGERLACAVLARKPAVVVVPTATDRESGYLLAAKLRSAKRKPRVVLVAPARTPEAERFAKFVGATLVAEKDDAGALVRAVVG